jgi:hypothetical protein
VKMAHSLQIRYVVDEARVRGMRNQCQAQACMSLFVYHPGNSSSMTIRLWIRSMSKSRREEKHDEGTDRAREVKKPTASRLLQGTPHLISVASVETGMDGAVLRRKQQEC